MIMSLLTFGLYLANQKFRLTDQLASHIDSYDVNPISRAAFKALASDADRRGREALEKLGLTEFRGKRNRGSRFANQYFLS
jgi:hypothetical protein